MAASSEERRWPLWLIGIELAVAVGGSAGAAFLCMADERAGLPCLGSLRPLIVWATAFGRPLDVRVPALLVPPLCVATLVAYLVLVRRERVPAEGRRWDLGAEAAALALLTLVAIIYRFYALNRIPPDNVNDVSFSLLSASDWHSTFDSNVFGGAPLGLFHHLLLKALWHLFGATVPTLRFASALTSIVVAQSLYGLVRCMAGPFAAVIAMGLFVFSPVETVWGRHDMFPFSASPLALLLALSTYLALTRCSARHWIATALLMGATYHLFPSGIAAVLVPFGAAAWTVLFDRARLRRAAPGLLFALPIGLLLWLAGRSFATYLANGDWQWLGPFDPRLASRVARGGGWTEAWSGFAENGRQILAQIYLDWPGDTHQTPISLFGVPRTWVTPLVAALFGAGLARCFLRRRDPASGVLVAMLAAGALPGIVSIAAAHRVALLFPAMIALAALAAAELLEILERRSGARGRIVKIAVAVVVLVASSLATASAYFRQRSAEPPAVTLASSLRPFLSPGTLMVLELPLGLQIDMTFLFFDDMLRDRSAVVWAHGENWPQLVADPEPDLGSAYYLSTALRHQVPELRGRRWDRVVYVLYQGPDAAGKADFLRSTFPGAKVTKVTPRTWRPGYGFTAVEVERGAPGEAGGVPGSR